MSALPPYVRDSSGPGCGAGIYVQAEEYETKPQGGKPVKALRVRAELIEGAPAVMSACGCAWLREAVHREGLS